MRRLKVGYGLKKNIDLGPLIHVAAVEKVRSLVDETQLAGAKVLVGPMDFSLPKKGCFYAPTVLDRVEASMRLSREEIFGPVYALQSYADIDEDIAASNHSEYGLSGYVY